MNLVEIYRKFRGDYRIKWELPKNPPEEKMKISVFTGPSQSNSESGSEISKIGSKNSFNICEWKQTKGYWHNKVLSFLWHLPVAFRRLLRKSNSGANEMKNYLAQDLRMVRIMPQSIIHSVRPPLRHKLLLDLSITNTLSSLCLGPHLVVIRDLLLILLKDHSWLVIRDWTWVDPVCRANTLISVPT